MEIEYCGLFYRAGTSDKVYIAKLYSRTNADNTKSFTVTFSWGRRGAKFQEKWLDFTWEAAARLCYNNKIQEKLKEGYLTLEDQNWKQILSAASLPYVSGVPRLLKQPLPPQGSGVPRPWKQPLPTQVKTIEELITDNKRPRRLVKF